MQAAGGGGDVAVFGDGPSKICGNPSLLRATNFKLTMAVKSRRQCLLWASVVTILPVAVSFHIIPMHKRAFSQQQWPRRATLMLPSSSLVPRRQLHATIMCSKVGNKDEIQGTKKGGTASIPNLTTSLVKPIVGSGALALPAGIATLAW